MEKGILYLGCTALILAGGVIGFKALENDIATSKVQTVYVKQVVTPTVEPTATPSATLRSVKVYTPATAVTKTVK